jgi:predicted nucleic acid-binding protein
MAQTIGVRLSRFLLDTNVVSELRKPRPHGGVLAWCRAADSADLAIPALVLGELQLGAELTRKQDSAKAIALEAWIERIASTYQVVPMDGACFREWARLIHRVSDTLREDAMIAAIARVHGLTVATRNEADFKALAVPVVNPFRHSV